MRKASTPGLVRQMRGLRLLDLVLDLLGLLLSGFDDLAGVVESYPGYLDNADAAQEEVDGGQP